MLVRASRRAAPRVLLLIAALSGCGRSEPPPAHSPRSLRVAIAADEGSLQPYTYVTGYPGWNMLSLVYDTLFTLDADNRPVPWLALDDAITEDGRRHALRLRPGVRWHDATPLTSADVAFSIDYYQQHPHGRWSPAVRAITKTETPDAQTVVLVLDAPDPGLPMRFLADVPIIPRHLWQGVDDPRAMRGIVGTGPFRLVEHLDDRLYRFEANPHYFAGAPAVDELLMPVVTDAATTFAAIESGELHATTRELSPELMTRFSGREDVRMAAGPGFATTLLQFNTERAPWNDGRVRRAVALGIDTRQLVDTVLLGHGVPGGQGWLHPRLPGYDTARQSAVDRQAAATLLDAAGLRDTNGDGVREFKGRPLAPALLVQANQPGRVRAAELISSAMQALGIAVRVRAEDAASVTAQVWPEFDVARGRDFDWAMFGWSAPVMVDPLRMSGLVDSNVRIGTNNIGGFRHAEADRLSAILRTTVDAAERTATLRALDALIATERPFVMLWYADLAFAYRPAAFDGWRFQTGQGIFHKGSFVRPPVP